MDNGGLLVIFALLLFPFQIVFAMICAARAKRKGLNGVLWGFRGFFFGIIAWVCVLCIPGQPEEQMPQLEMPLPPTNIMPQ